MIYKISEKRLKNNCKKICQFRIKVLYLIKYLSQSKSNKMKNKDFTYLMLVLLTLAIGLTLAGNLNF